MYTTQIVRYWDMKKISILILLIVVVWAGFRFYNKGSKQVNATLSVQDSSLTVAPVITKKTREVASGDTFTDIIQDLGYSYSDALRIVENGGDIFDFTSIKVGKVFTLVSYDNEATRIEYEPGTEYIVIIDLLQDFSVEKRKISYDIEITAVSLIINDSMYLDGISAGIDPLLIIEFANIFAWEIDFATQVRRGDKVTILYEKRFRDGVEAGFGNILAGEFINSGQSVQGYRYVNVSGDIGYYNQDGESLVRPFLKVPLEFSRITSGFTYNRFHPTLKRNIPHLAIDYAAPYGTPIYAVGDGVIRIARYRRGDGNYISLRHNGKFTTNYAHMSGFAKGIRPSVRVKQGDVIAYVGSTGFSTGNHLHYEVEVNGKKVNPLEVEFPKGDSIAGDEAEAFNNKRDELRAKF